MRFSKLSITTLRQQVYEQLWEKIVYGGLLPGETLSLRGLAQEFGVSVMPVREALWQLEAERIVVIEPNRKIRVTTLAVPERQEIFKMRLLLEPLAAERSCELRPDSALPKAKSLLEQTVAHLQKSAKKFIEANFAFHHLIYSYGASPVLMRHVDLLWARVGPYFCYVHLQKIVDLSGSQQYHQAMYDAWVTRDKEKMVESLRGDLMILPLRFFPQDGEQGGRGAASPAARGVSAQSVSQAFLESWKTGNEATGDRGSTRNSAGGVRDLAALGSVE